VLFPVPFIFSRACRKLLSSQQHDACLFKNALHFKWFQLVQHFKFDALLLLKCHGHFMTSALPLLQLPWNASWLAEKVLASNSNSLLTPWRARTMLPG
jgi:hypothetical protein